jgi:3-hydroxyisobutyrate dehydrogenase-like beta-hydroxyacid dehydrogenase
VNRLGLLFPGEMGTEIGAAARGEVLWAREGRSEATAHRAEGAGFRDAGTLSALVADSEVVLSLCPPAIAEEVACDVARLGFGGLYVEANAIAPDRARTIADLIRAAGGRAVDGAVIAHTGLNLYLSGEDEDVREAAALFDGGAVNAIALPGGVGGASALKMAFGGWNKIGTALAAQAYAIATAYGVEEALAGEGVESGRILRAAPKAWRWAPEMDEVARTCAELGLPEELGRGAALLFERWVSHRDREVQLEQLLADLPRIERAREL